MTMFVVVIVAMVAGFIGGVVASAFMEAFFARIASNKIGEYEAVEPEPSYGKRAAR